MEPLNIYQAQMQNVHFVNYNIPQIREVIFHPPATVINWTDGIKTVVKCRADDKFDREKGLALCVMKRMLGDQFHKALKQYISEAPVPNTLTMEQAQDLLNVVERYLNDHPGKEILSHRTGDGMKTRYEIIDSPARKEKNKEKCLRYMLIHK